MNKTSGRKMYRYQENFLACSALHGCNIVAEDDFGWPHECSHNKILFLYYCYDIKTTLTTIMIMIMIIRLRRRLLHALLALRLFFFRGSRLHSLHSDVFSYIIQYTSHKRTLLLPLITLLLLWLWLLCFCKLYEIPTICLRVYPISCPVCAVQGLCRGRDPRAAPVA